MSWLGRITGRGERLENRTIWASAGIAKSNAQRARRVERGLVMSQGSTSPGEGAFNDGPGHDRAMRVRVESSWTTRVLFLVVFVVAGVIAWYRVQGRLEVERAGVARQERPSTDGVEVEVEVVEAE